MGSMILYVIGNINNGRAKNQFGPEYMLFKQIYYVI